MSKPAKVDFAVVSRLTAERNEVFAANGILANLLGKRDAEITKLRAALEEIVHLDSPPLGRYGIIAREALKSE